MIALVGPGLAEGCLQHAQRVAYGYARVGSTADGVAIPVDPFDD